MNPGSYLVTIDQKRSENKIASPILNGARVFPISLYNNNSQKDHLPGHCAKGKGL